MPADNDAFFFGADHFGADRVMSDRVELCAEVRDRPLPPCGRTDTVRIVTGILSSTSGTGVSAAIIAAGGDLWPAALVAIAGQLPLIALAAANARALGEVIASLSRLVDAMTSRRLKLRHSRSVYRLRRKAARRPDDPALRSLQYDFESMRFDGEVAGGARLPVRREVKESGTRVNDLGPEPLNLHIRRRLA